MDKKELLKHVSKLSAENKIGKDELLAAWDHGAIGNSSRSVENSTFLAKLTNRSKLSLSDILYAIGGLVVIIGITIFIGQQWDDLNTALRILVTLGFSFVLFVSGFLFHQDKRTGELSQAFFFISNFLLPLGVYVTLYELGANLESIWLHTLIMFALMVFYLVTYYLTKLTQFVAFGIIFGTAFFFSLSDNIFEMFRGDVARSQFLNLGIYRVMVFGLSHTLLGYAFSYSREKSLTPALYFVGLNLILGSAFSLGLQSSVTGSLWTILFIFLLMAAIYLSVFVKSRVFLYLSALYLLAYIFRITAEYFSDSVGWPLALIVAGFALIGVGYTTFSIQRKYLGKN